MGYKKTALTSDGPAPYFVGRRMIFNGVVVHIEVPGNVEETFVVLEPSRKRACLKFIRPVKGGHVAIYVHSLMEKHPAAGDKIATLLTVWKEGLSDGRTFLSLHLIVTDREPTHAWRVVQLANNELPERFKVSGGINFPVLPPLQGFVVVTPLELGRNLPSGCFLDSRWALNR